MIENVDQIYTIDKTNAYEVDETAEAEDTEDVYITINGNKYSKTDVAAQLTAMGYKTDAGVKDETIMKKVNALSDEEEETFFAELTPVNG